MTWNTMCLDCETVATCSKYGCKPKINGRAPQVLQPLVGAPAEVVLDFAQVGTAGPFPVVNGRVAVPDVTMHDLAHMLKPTTDAASPQVLQPLAPPPGERTESVLIDGVAYTIPAAVAGELLRLHMELLGAPADPPIPLKPMTWKATPARRMTSAAPWSTWPTRWPLSIGRRPACLRAATMAPEIPGRLSAVAMEWLGDALNDMDAVADGDTWMADIFARAQKRWPAVLAITVTVEQARMLAEALDIGQDAAAAEAAQYHEAMAGYRPERHKAMDEDVAKVKAAAEVLSELIQAADGGVPA